MRIPAIKAKARLAELVRRSEMGDDVVLTRRGQPVARLVPIKIATTRAARRELLESMLGSGRCKASRGRSAERSQDFLYDKYGLPK
jgi:prevent-host-death family protein